MGSDLTPTYLATCPECAGLIGVSVADVDRPATMARALKDRREWERAGFVLSTVTVQAIREWAGEIGHTEACVIGTKAKRRHQRQEAREAARDARLRSEA